MVEIGLQRAALVVGGVALTLLTHAAHAQEDLANALSLQEAERLALEKDPGIARFMAQADALTEQAVADGQLPDPKFRLGFLNFPTDSFSRTQEPMTQIQLGIQQAFPRGNSLSVKTRRTKAMSRAQRDRAREQGRLALRELRQSWLEHFYWVDAERIVQSNKGYFTQLVEVTQYQYAVGKQNQQDVLRAQLELSMLDDRLEKIRSQQDKSRAQLSKWVGSTMANRPLSSVFPKLASPPAQAVIEADLLEHPLVKVDQAQVKANQENVALAREAYKPGWSLGVYYGFRDGQNPNGDSRTDFFTAMVTVDVPIFHDKRQDRRLAASQYQVQAAMLARDERMRDLKEVLDAQYAEWKRLGERHDLYQHTLLLQAQNNAQAALLAYQNDTGDFASLMRARITELDTRLKALRIRVDRAKTQSRLLYLAGDVPR